MIMNTFLFFFVLYTVMFFLLSIYIVESAFRWENQWVDAGKYFWKRHICPPGQDRLMAPMKSENNIPSIVPLYYPGM